MTGRYARGACPRLAEPMQTGDGLLARIVAAGPVPLDVFSRLCAAARQHGNGVIEISARGSLQVRGLTQVSAPLFGSYVTSLDIDLDEGVPVIADPLPDDSAALVDANTLAADLRQAVAEKRIALAPKVSVVVDGGGGLHLDALNADIRLRAVATLSGPMLHVALAGDAASATTLGLAAPGHAVTIATQLLAAIGARGPEARARDLLRNTGIGALRAALDIEPARPLPARPRAEFDRSASSHRWHLRPRSRTCLQSCASGCTDRIGRHRSSTWRALGSACARPCATSRTIEQG